MNSKNKVTENLIGIGAGIGLSHSLTDNIEIIMMYKINNHFNSKKYDFAGFESSYSLFNIAFDYKIE